MCVEIARKYGPAAITHNIGPGSSEPALAPRKSPREGSCEDPSGTGRLSSRGLVLGSNQPGTVPLRGSQLRILVQAWADHPDYVYDVDWLVRRLGQITNANALGGEVSEVLAAAINEGYLYVDKIKSFNAFSGFRAFVGLTASGQAAWNQVYPHLAGQHPVYGGQVPPD